MAMATTTATARPSTGSRAEHRWAPLTLAIARVALGWVFLWPFLDKLFGLGKATPSERAWVNGGSPTAGYLKGVTAPDSENPFKGFFEIFVGHAWADWLFMIGLLGIGVALLVGAGMRIAAVSATLLLGLMWLASFPLENNPFIDDHVVYALLAIALAATASGDFFGFGHWWKSRKFVADKPWLH
jgi:thiosulfate dehydrogenase [quinone] large subunit